jgi:1-acyl-sn-glycerol-3-phosphate acyltransferase
MTPMRIDTPLSPLPPKAPRAETYAWMQKFSLFMLKHLGWRMQGQWPDIKKAVFIVAPHSSVWDVIIGLLFIQATGVRMEFMGKQEAFVGPIGKLLRYYGGMPVNRTAPGGIIEHVAGKMRASERMWFALAPEGTRKVTEQWKTGFWKIAKQAEVPVCCVYFHFPEKIIGVGAVFELGDDMSADIAKIRAWYQPYQGKHHGV